jgi:gluconolactonase
VGVFLKIYFKQFFVIAANERVVIDFRVKGERPSFVPDGMTIDSEGNLYVATFGGSSVFKIDPK